jgi:hypothetical protein
MRTWPRVRQRKRESGGEGESEQVSLGRREERRGGSGHGGQGEGCREGIHLTDSTEFFLKWTGSESGASGSATRGASGAGGSGGASGGAGTGGDADDGGVADGDNGGSGGAGGSSTCGTLICDADLDYCRVESPGVAGGLPSYSCRVECSCPRRCRARRFISAITSTARRGPHHRPARSPSSTTRHRYRGPRSRPGSPSGACPPETRRPRRARHAPARSPTTRDARGS